MKKIFTLAAVAALVLASCAKIETTERNVDDPIAFRPYSGTAITKAGTAGEMTTATLQTEGFGVFAYQNTGAYDGSVVPNFMYNTKVSTSSWTYSPIKYWPNQIQSGDTDRQTDPAQATKVDVVSFFAYAPHVAASALSGATSGITGLSANNATGDPKVTYTVSDDLDNQVDLLWGVVNPATDQTWQTVVSGKTISLAKGMPYKNLQKPAINTAIHFYFRHALAQLTLTAVGAYNQVAEGGEAKNGVKITISKVELTVPGMTQTATLNLNNTTANQPLWESASGSANLALTVTGDNLNAALKDAGDVNASAQPAGVIATSATNVITNGKYYTVIPTSTSTTVNVKVTYYVTTDDTDLAAGHSRVENVISHDVVFSSGFAAGTKNTIKMILGISEVKFEAEVVDWAVGVNGEVNLPQNL